MREILLASLILVISITVQAESSGLCPSSCYCETTDKVVCERADFDKVPTTWPIAIRSLSIFNSSLQILHKNTFKRYSKLEELIIERCEEFNTIEKHAFKGLPHLRLIRLVDNKNLKNLAKGSFSLISSRHVLRIQLRNNGFDVVTPGIFRHSSQLRELSLEGESLHIETNAFAGLTNVDFFNIIGASQIDQSAFENVSRVYRFEISQSSMSLNEGVFTSVSHVKEMYISRSEIDTIAPDAFRGLFTVGRIVLHGNSIGNLSTNAFASVVNVGEIVVEDNVIDRIHADALESPAWRTKFRDNTLKCSCDILSMKHIRDAFVMKRNFCGADDFYRSLINYAPTCTRPQQSLSPKLVPLSNALLLLIVLVAMFF